MAPGNVNTRLASARKLLEGRSPPTAPLPSAPVEPVHIESWRELLLRLTGIDVTQCPKCGSVLTSAPLARVPAKDTS